MLPTLGPGFDRVNVLRVMGAAAAREADLHGRRAMLFDQLASRTESERYYQESLQVALALPGRPRSTIGFAASSVAFAQRERAAALSRLGRHGEAQSLLDEHLQFIQRHALPGATAAGAHHAQAGLRIGQRQFAEAERQLRLAIQSLDDLRYPRSHPHQVSKVRDLALVLWARGDAQAAQAELRLLDERLQRDGAPEVRGRMPYERGLVPRQPAPRRCGAPVRGTRAKQPWRARRWALLRRAGAGPACGGARAVPTRRSARPPASC